MKWKEKKVGIWRGIGSHKYRIYYLVKGRKNPIYTHHLYIYIYVCVYAPECVKYAKGFQFDPP